MSFCLHPKTTTFEKCDICGEVLFPEETDKAPNHFELFGLQPQYNLNPKTVENKFYELTRLFHPDKYQTKGFEHLKAATHWSAVLNKAFHILKDDDERAFYLFELAQFKPVDSKNSLPPTLAEDYFSLTELLDDGENPEAAKAKLDEFKSRLEEQVRLHHQNQHQAFSDWEKAQTPLDQRAHPHFSKALSALRQKNYLRSMAEDLEKKWRS